MASSTLFTCLVVVLYLKSAHCVLNKPKVIIIGGGAAGIAAGSRLIDNGLNDNVIILEAENRTGGRIHTIEFEGATLELGSQSLNVDEDRDVFKIANGTNLIEPTRLNVTKSKFVQTDGNAVPKETSSEIQTIFNRILNDLETMKNDSKSVREFVEKRLEENDQIQRFDKDLVKKYFEWCMKEKITYLAVESMHEMTSKAYAEYFLRSFSKTWVWDSPGMKTFLDALMGKFPNNNNNNMTISLEDKIILNKKVTNINWSSSNKTHITVNCADGSHFVANHVIVTVPLGVLKENADTLFTPDLPEEKRNAIKYMGYGTTDVMYLKFAERWWPKQFDGFSFLWDTNSTLDNSSSPIGGKYENKNWIRSLAGFYPVDNQNNILAGYLAANDARHVETLTDSEVQNGCLEALKLFVGKKYKIPESVSIIRSKWFSNPHFRGVNSYKSKETFEHNVGPVQLAKSLHFGKNNPAVLFAGEATSDDHYASVYGAILSGWKAADDILQFTELERLINV